jgi:hypothetical protein
LLRELLRLRCQHFFKDDPQQLYWRTNIRANDPVLDDRGRPRQHPPFSAPASSDIFLMMNMLARRGVPADHTKTRWNQASGRYSYSLKPV